MSDSADIKMAAQQLSQALQNLEQALDPILSDYGQLKKQVDDSASFETDRARLAQELDNARSREQEFNDLKKEFGQLATETSSELERAISKVQNVLERD